MWRWEDVKTRRCEDVKMWICENVWQTPTIRRTLRSDALGKNETTIRNQQESLCDQKQWTVEVVRCKYECTNCGWDAGEMTEAAHQWITEPMNHESTNQKPTNQWVNESTNKGINEPMIQYINESLDKWSRWINESLSQWLEPVNQWVLESTNLWTNVSMSHIEPMRRWANESVNQCVDGLGALNAAQWSFALPSRFALLVFTNPRKSALCSSKLLVVLKNSPPPPSSAHNFSLHSCKATSRSTTMNCLSMPRIYFCASIRSLLLWAWCALTTSLHVSIRPCEIRKSRLKTPPAGLQSLDSHSENSVFCASETHFFHATETLVKLGRGPGFFFWWATRP